MASQDVQNFATMWTVLGLPSIGAVAVVVGKWVVAHGAAPRLEEARKVVADIDRVMNAIPHHVREAMNETEDGGFRRLAQQHVR